MRWIERAVDAVLENNRDRGSGRLKPRLGASGPQSPPTRTRLLVPYGRSFNPRRRVSWRHQPPLGTVLTASLRTCLLLPTSFVNLHQSPASWCHSACPMLAHRRWRSSTFTPWVCRGASWCCGLVSIDVTRRFEGVANLSAMVKRRLSAAMRMAK